MENKATLIGFGAILMWALLSTLTALTGQVPPFLLVSLTFLIGAIPGVIFWLKKPKLLRDLRQPVYVWCIGVCGLFGYHFLFFTALRHSTPIEATLINYLWPLLIVLFSALLPNERLRWFHLVGALLGFLGMIFVVSNSGAVHFNSKNNFGNIVAFCGALTWTAYSLLSRRISHAPTSLITAFCLVTSALALICHLAFHEPNILPQNLLQWFSLIGLGLFPVGLSFYCWDYGVKHGNIQIIGVASYAAPLLSTALLIATGLAPATWQIGMACILITCGALLASKNLLAKKSVIRNKDT